MEFVVEGTLAHVDKVTFRAEVDDDGDLMLYANGYKLLFITHTRGYVGRMVMSSGRIAALPGFSFDDTGRVELA